MKTFAVQMLPLSAARPFWRNSKRHDQRQINALVNAIKAGGFDQPIVVDGEGVIIKGHGRRIAALQLKMEFVPVVVRDDLTPEQVQASRIADNRAFMMSEVDPAIEREEVLDFVAEGGEGAEVFFDFLQPKGEKPQSGATSPEGAPVDPMGMALLNCPKCHHTFAEST